ncbi:MAG TPA: hypothetical protein IAB72_00165 [Candidatus Onthoplasma faecipullorum]|nr:hypothetical protein [Candidatus Onthoplasma faecipullorum]
MKKIKLIFKRKLPIGQTLETKDKFLPIDKRHSQKLKDSRPLIILDKIKNPKGQEEYAVVTASTKETNNTKRFNKYGLKYIRNNLEIEDNEGKPIIQNEKFKVTKNSTRISKEDADKLLNYTLNHNRFSSENRKKHEKFKNRYKK